MADKPADKTLLPTLLTQNPSMPGKAGQDRITTRREQVDSIMGVFLQLLPSNYVAQVQGPFYTIQFQAAAEAIADFQLAAQETYSDSDYDFMRGEFLYQLLGALVFPDAQTDGYPDLKGDLTYREFLRRMVLLLLQGAVQDSIEGGLALLSDATFTVIDKALAARDTTKKVYNPELGVWETPPGSAWGLDDQFEFEVNVSYTDPVSGEERFPEEPFVLVENVRIVMRALKPAHTIYEYRHLFTEAFDGLFDESTPSWDISNYYYADLRKFCCGAKNVTGTAGITWTDRTLFSDTSREFDQISLGAELVVTSGVNAADKFRVADLLTFPVGTDATPRAYTTSPTGLVGEATVTGSVIEDSLPMGLIINDSLIVPNVGSVRFAAGAFFIQVGDELLTPVAVAAFSPNPVGVEYLTLAAPRIGMLRFNSTILADNAGEMVVYQGDWSVAVEGEVLTFSAGPNAGSYRLKSVLGNTGGPVGASGAGERVQVAQCLLRLDRRMGEAATGQSYTVVVDRLGVQEFRTVTAEDVTVYFTGAGPALDTFPTARGPLVKGWGDATPASEQDVVVRVNGAPVTVSSVNPYIGTVTLAVPLALPQTDVVVDYKWFKAPVMELAGLNTEGLVLNKWDCTHGHHFPPAHGDEVQAMPGFPKGAVDIHRFPMNIALGPIDRFEPLYIGHRYIGFERAYSALVNSPTTLLLNQAPGRASVPGFERTVVGSYGAYEGLVQPTAASPAWALGGVNYGGVDHNDETGLDLGTFTVIDALVGNPGPNATSTVYHRGLDLSFPSSVSIVARFQTSPVLFDSSYASPTPAPTGLAAAPVAEGVFTGIGFGTHDNRYLYFCGILVVNGVEHVGLLLDPKRLHEFASWEIGPTAVLTASSQTRGSFPSASVPTGFTVGSRFQQYTGTQVGVYTATAVTAQTDGTTTVDFTPALPVPWDLWGNKFPEMVFETLVSDNPFTYRLDIDTSEQIAELRIAGGTTGIAATITANVPALPSEGETSLNLPRQIVGQVFWGSMSCLAASRATWSFMRYGQTPDQVFLTGHWITNATNMGVLPDDNTVGDGGPWWPTKTFGSASVSGGSLLLKSTSHSDTYDLQYGYSRIEPFFDPDSILDVDLTVRADTVTAGGLGAELLLDDTQRLVSFSTLLVRESLTADPTHFRDLVFLPQVSHAGLFAPTELGWAAETGSTLESVQQGAQMVSVQDATHRGRWEKHLVWGAADPTLVAEDEGRIFEARLEVTARTTNAAGDSGIVFGGQMQGTGAPFAVVQVELAGAVGAEEVRLRTATGAPVQTYVYNWAGAAHTYRVVADRDANTVTLLIDDVVQAPAVAFVPFVGGVNKTQSFFGCTGRDAADIYDNSLTATVEWHWFHAHAQAPTDLKRTVGVLRGMQPDLDPTDINSYEIPRDDASTAPNSWQTGPSIQWLDWRSDVVARVLRDPGWGVTVFLPALGVPPFYQAEDGTAGKGFITESSEPSAGWINVEYRELPPTLGGSLGLIAFGSFDTGEITQSRWDFVRYRLSRHPTEDRIAPEHMVLNQFNVMVSGELALDTSLETVIVQSMDLTRLTLLPTHLYAESVYKVIDGSTIWTSEDWTFDTTSQLLSLLPDPLTGVQRQFSSEHANLTVMFIPGHPVTNTYLTNHPLLDGVTILNEGTPPVPKSQVGTSTYATGTGTIVHSDLPGTHYEELEFIEVDNDGEEGLIAFICEGGPGEGFSGLDDTEGEDIYSLTGGGAALGGVGSMANHFATGDKVGKAVGAEVIDLSGTVFWNEMKFPANPDWTQKGGTPGGILFASGGSFVLPVLDGAGVAIPGAVVAAGGTIGPGSAVLYPSYPAIGPVGGDQGRIYKRTDWYMVLRGVLTDASVPTTQDLDEDVFPTPTWDATPPSVHDAAADPNVDGVPNALGSAVGVMVDSVGPVTTNLNFIPS
jgi:hypothetical protein